MIKKHTITNDSFPVSRCKFLKELHSSSQENCQKNNKTKQTNKPSPLTDTSDMISVKHNDDHKQQLQISRLFRKIYIYIYIYCRNMRLCRSYRLSSTTVVWAKRRKRCQKQSNNKISKNNVIQFNLYPPSETNEINWTIEFKDQTNSPMTNTISPINNWMKHKLTLGQFSKFQKKIETKNSKVISTSGPLMNGSATNELIVELTIYPPPGVTEERIGNV